MAIESSATDSLLPASGRFRARYSYTFTDGRVIARGPVELGSRSDSDIKRDEMEPDVLESMQKRDASSAVDQGVKGDYREASGDQVQYQGLSDGLSQDEHYKAYDLMSEVWPDLVSSGLSDDQIAAKLGSTVTEINASHNYWDFLDTNSSVIIAYRDLA